MQGEPRDERVVRIPAEVEGRLVVVRVALADGAEARMVVDTGAGASALSVACVERLRLPLHRDQQVRTPLGLSVMGFLVLPSLRVGPFEVRGLRVARVPLPRDRVDGLLGLDFFRAAGARAVTLHLDTPRLDVLLHRARGDAPDRPAEALE